MKNKIVLMPDNLANMIAAGEVIDKCVNIVKELVENSIDAGSKKIIVNLLSGGLKKIEVIDNGSGMTREDALMSLKRHATSKLLNEHDLFNIVTLGFRGEAIPSIASVSDMKIYTSSNDETTYLHVRGGELVEENIADLKNGTKIVVTDLFFNTPVRFKYLKNIDINNIHLSAYGNTYIATIASKAYKINATFYRVLCCIKSGLSVEDAIYQVSVEIDTDYDVLFEKFCSFIKRTQRVKHESYIRYKRAVIKEKLVNKIACSLLFLYSKYVFILLLFACITTNATYLYFNYEHFGSPSYYTIEMGIMVFIGYILSLIIHEIGHATATASMGKRAKEIGFGFYIIFPVFYTDVTSVWNMKKKERILVSFGGVYFQLLVNVFIIGLIYFFPLCALIRVMDGLVISNILVVMISMTPFFRNDGYWILSDFWDIPNLLKKSDDALLHPYSRQEYDNKKERFKLIVFGFANNMFRIYVFIRLVLNLFSTLIAMIGMMTQNIMLNVVNIIISIIGIYWILTSYYKIFQYGNKNRY